MILHAITGLPRSGSTLLCNILNQNPNFHATPTSILSQLLNQIIQTWSTSIEIKGLLRNKNSTTDRMKNSLKAFISAWYAGNNVVFDKSRGWSYNAFLLQELYPESKIIVMIRDLRNVFASIEKHERANPLLSAAEGFKDKTIYTRADTMFAPEGIIGLGIKGIEDLIRRNSKNIIYIQYETLALEPEKTMIELYRQLGEVYYSHDFDNIKNVSNEPDEQYLYKYPHEGCGRVQPSDSEEWKKYLPQDIIDLIMEKFQGFNNFFGYK